jgi:predicted transcriptional regulator of viral defense system
MATPPAFDIEIQGKRRVERAVAVLAAGQHGVVARRQLLALGVGGGAIDHRVWLGRLHPVHRGVYAVGHGVLSQRGRWMAAVLAAGPGAVLSHRSAAALWRIRSQGGRAIEVTVPRWRRGQAGIELHCGAIAPDEITGVDGIPVTTVPRTIFDLAAVLPRDRAERAANEAEALRLGDSLSLADLVDRYPRRSGVGAIRAIVDDARLGAGITREEMEHRFQAFIAVHGLPRPAVNAVIPGLRRGYEGDCVWPQHRVVAELDSRAWHGTRAAFERDRERDRALVVAGWRVVRITWRQLHRDPEGLARDLRLLLQ